MAPLALFGDDLDMNGTPTAVGESLATPAAEPPRADILVVASQLAAQDGSYQALVTELIQKGKVEMQMVDRIMEGGESLPANLRFRNQRQSSAEPSCGAIHAKPCGPLASVHLGGDTKQRRGRTFIPVRDRLLTRLSFLCQQRRCPPASTRTLPSCCPPTSLRARC